jgi:light-regulated signal transduction histidine kinase (bacteriophytochrome)
LCRAQSIIDGNGEVVKWIGSCADIHEHKHLELGLQRSNQELKHLTAAATQDLQQHLRNVNGFCEMARQQGGHFALEADRCLEKLLEATTPIDLRLEHLLSSLQLNSASDSSEVLTLPLEFGLRPAKAEAFSTGV